MNSVIKASQLFIDPRGAINRKTFALGVLIIVAIGTLSSELITTPYFIMLISNCALFCLLSKRFRDIGISGRWALVPFALLATVFGLLQGSAFSALSAKSTGAGFNGLAALDASHLMIASLWVACGLIAVFVISGLCPQSFVRRKASQ